MSISGATTKNFNSCKLYSLGVHKVFKLGFTNSYATDLVTIDNLSLVWKAMPTYVKTCLSESL